MRHAGGSATLLHLAGRTEGLGGALCVFHRTEYYVRSVCLEHVEGTVSDEVFSSCCLPDSFSRDELSSCKVRMSDFRARYNNVIW